MGAGEDDGTDFSDRRDHWSFQPLRSSELPAVEDADWPRNPVDNHVLARLEDEGFAPAAPAAPEILLRRVHLDLVGLPPTVDEIEAFRSDPSDEHFERIVDRLLGSEQYGVKWARFWLDLARYAETAGGGRSYPTPSAWRAWSTKS